MYALSVLSSLTSQRPHQTINFVENIKNGTGREKGNRGTGEHVEESGGGADICRNFLILILRSRGLWYTREKFTINHRKKRSIHI